MTKACSFSVLQAYYVERNNDDHNIHTFQVLILIICFFVVLELEKLIYQIALKCFYMIGV